MIIPATRITETERMGLRMMALNLRFATHKTTKDLACLLNTVSRYEAGQSFDTEALDMNADAAEVVWQNAFGREQALLLSEFHAAKECRFAARSIGANSPETFAENLADAAKALLVAQDKADKLANAAR